MKEWLCLTCQMQRALKATESVEAPRMKSQASPNKVSTPAAAQKDATANQKKDIMSTQKADIPDKNQRDSPTPTAQQKKEETKTSSIPLDKTQTSVSALLLAQETPDTVSVPTKEEKADSPPINEAPISTAPPTKEMAVVDSDLTKTIAAQAPPASKDSETSPKKKKDLTPPSSPAPKGESEKKKEKVETVQKSVDQQIKSSDEVQPQQALNKESKPVQTPSVKSAPTATQPTNQESGGFFSFGSPKSQRAASKTTDAVTGKMMGFGSSLFSSASTLITSAVKEESRTTPPSSRKMSAPAQVSDKMSALKTKSSPPASPRMTSAKEAKPPPTQEPVLKKIPDQPEQTKAPPSGQDKVDKGQPELAKPEDSQAAPKVASKEAQCTCPLCKAELNVGSEELPNYNTCTECETTVCNKCGFNPNPNVAQVIKQLIKIEKNLC